MRKVQGRRRAVLNRDGPKGYQALRIRMIGARFIPVDSVNGKPRFCGKLSLAYLQFLTELPDDSGGVDVSIWHFEFD